MPKEPYFPHRDDSPRTRPRGRSFLFLALALPLAAVAPASAATTPLNCATPGWNEVDYFLSSSRHPVDARDFNWDARYENHIDYQWQFWFNPNVTKVQFVFDRGRAPDPATSDPGVPGFDLEGSDLYAFDYLRISGANTVTLTGPLDQNHTVEYTSPEVTPSFAQGAWDSYVDLLLHTDGSVTHQGFTIKKVRMYCGRSNSPASPASNVSRLHANGQREGVLLGPGDIRYFSTVQEADRELILVLKPDAASPSLDHADYDLYASPTAPTNTPGPGVASVDYQWRSIRGRVQVNGKWRMYDDVIVIPPVGYARYIYYSVHWYGYDSAPNGVGGFRVYDNTVGRKFALRVSTDFNDRADASSWARLQWAMRMAAAGLYAATDGTGWVSSFDFWHNDPTCGGQGCHIVYSNGNCGGALAFCSAVGCNFQNARIVDCRWNFFASIDHKYLESMTMAHEFAHCAYNIGHEYNSNNTDGYNCGHTIMLASNQSEWRGLRDFCTGTLATGNHGQDPRNAFDAPVNDGNWTRANQCSPSQFTSYLPTGTPATPDPEAWEQSDIWSYPSVLPITQRN